MLKQGFHYHYSALGLVRSNPVLTGFQVFSRVFVTWVIVHSFPEAQVSENVTCLMLAVYHFLSQFQASRGFPLLLLAWTITEIIRYSFYALNLVGQNPYLVAWLRYTLFIVLYPLGVVGELWYTH